MKTCSGWESILRSPECCDVLEDIADRRKKGELICPIQKNIFRAFKDCPFEKVRVVILGQDPYARKGQAIGRAFAVPEPTEKVPGSLMNIFREVRRDFPNGKMPKLTLQSWSNQGVLLLNTTLTVKEGSINSHSNVGWNEAVTIPTLEKLSAEREHLVFLLWGNKAKGFKRHILHQARHCVLEASHPSPRSVAKGFHRCGHFREANNYLKRHGIEPIAWTNRP